MPVTNGEKNCGNCLFAFPEDLRDPTISAVTCLVLSYMRVARQNFSIGSGSTHLLPHQPCHATLESEEPAFKPRDNYVETLDIARSSDYGNYRFSNQINQWIDKTMIDIKKYKARKGILSKEP